VKELSKWCQGLVGVNMRPIGSAYGIVLVVVLVLLCSLWVWYVLAVWHPVVLLSLGVWIIEVVEGTYAVGYYERQ
jgi:hypothetical protein